MILITKILQDLTDVKSNFLYWSMMRDDPADQQVLEDLERSCLRLKLIESAEQEFVVQALKNIPINPSNVKWSRQHHWKSGPDPQRHDQFQKFGQQKNQAQWRKEPWYLTFDEFVQIWYQRWHLRGRGVNDLCLTRIDYFKPWQLDNVEILNRGNHIRNQKIKLGRCPSAATRRKYKRKLLFGSIKNK